MSLWRGWPLHLLDVIRGWRRNDQRAFSSIEGGIVVSVLTLQEAGLPNVTLKSCVAKNGVGNIWDLIMLGSSWMRKSNGQFVEKRGCVGSPDFWCWPVLSVFEMIVIDQQSWCVRGLRCCRWQRLAVAKGFKHHYSSIF